MSINSDPRDLSTVYEQILQYQETGSNEIATSLLIKYEPMVQMAARKISRNRPDLYEDLLQIGHMSLLRLFKQYDVSLGVQFEPYMMKSIIGHMKNFLRDKSWYIQVPRRIKEKGFQLQNAIDNLTARLERSPKVKEIAKEVGLTEEETIEILAGRECYHYVSLDTPLSEEENGATIGDILANTADDYGQVDRKLVLQEALNVIKEDERQVLYLAYVEGHSQRTIAEELNVSQMSVSRMQRRALDKLRAYFAEQGQSADI
jgi:RNA polymerase sigma-B factor